MSETTQTQNDEEKELEIELQNHYNKVFEKDNNILIVDLSTKDRDKETIDMMTYNVSRLLIGENANVKENVEPVNVVGIEFPSKRIFLITEQEHFLKHYYLLIEKYWMLKEKDIEEFVNNKPTERDDYALFVNREKPYALGVHAHYFTVSSELMDDVIKEIGKGLMAALGYSIDKIKIEEERSSYIYFIPRNFIYDNKIIKRHIMRSYVWNSEEEKKYGYKINWVSLYEIDENFIEYLTGP